MWSLIKEFLDFLDGVWQGENYHMVAYFNLCVAGGDKASIAAHHPSDDGPPKIRNLRMVFFVMADLGLATSSMASASIPLRHFIEVTSAPIVKRMI